MAYTSYLFCLALMIPAFLLTALVALMSSVSGFFSGVFTFLAWIGAAITEPLRYGWRIAALLAALGFAGGAGAIPPLQVWAFRGLALAGTLCVSFCLHAASRQEPHQVWSALLALSPSIAGILASLWFALKFKT